MLRCVSTFRVRFYRFEQNFNLNISSSTRFWKLSRGKGRTFARKPTRSRSYSLGMARGLITALLIAERILGVAQRPLDFLLTGEIVVTFERRPILILNANPRIIHKWSVVIQPVWFRANARRELDLLVFPSQLLSSYPMDFLAGAIA